MQLKLKPKIKTRSGGFFCELTGAFAQQPGKQNAPSMKKGALPLAFYRVFAGDRCYLCDDLPLDDFPCPACCCPCCPFWLERLELEEDTSCS